MKKSILLALLLALLIAPAALAQGREPTPGHPPRPSGPTITFPPDWERINTLEIPYQRVDVTINGPVATTRVEQLFRNPGQSVLEGTYFFPLSKGAAVSELTMWVDGQAIEAKILPKDEARAIYDEIVRQLRDPALLEYVGSDAIQANVFPIPPGAERKIEIEYSQLLTAENGTFHYVYPQSADLYTSTPLDSQTIRVDLSAGEPIRTIYSPSHPVAVNRDGEFEAVVGYEANGVSADHDFELYYTVSPDEIGLDLLSYKEASEDGFFLLLVAPGIETGEVVDKDVILVLDTSGSMEGDKIDQARDAAAYVVEHLNEGDRFNIVGFSSGTGLYENGLIPATDPGDYGRYIDNLEAVGGTNISQALLEAAALADAERPTTIIFLTDGLATEGITETPLLLDTVSRALPANARVFAFGVGDDVDTTLLDTLAQEQRGATTYVRPGQAIDEAVSSFYAKVGSPVLTDIAVDFGDIRVDQLYPDTLPDLFAGEQLVLAGRFRDGGETAITLTGTTNGREQTFVYDDQSFTVEGGEGFIPRLWATRAIGHMMQQIRLRGENEELVQSIVNLSTRYGVITPYTSFLIEEDDILAQRDGFQTGDGVIEGPAMEAMGLLAQPTAVSGAAAVDRAEVEGAMIQSDIAAVEVTRVVGESATDGSAIVETAVKSVADKIFIRRGDVWVDTTYDSDNHPVQTLAFASDAYFDLLANRPELGPYLALGEQVLMVVDGQAVEVTADGTSSTDRSSPTTSTAVPITESDPVEVTAVPLEAADAPPAAEQGGLTVCGTVLVLPLLGLGLWGWNGRRKKSVTN